MKRIMDFVRRRRADRELAQEVESHLEEKIADLMDSGVPEPEARRKARREFGNVALCRQDSREAWGWVWLETLLQDLRYGARMLRGNPGFALVAVATLALGIAVNTTIFSAISGWMLRKPPLADPDRGVVVPQRQRAGTEMSRDDAGASEQQQRLGWHREEVAEQPCARRPPAAQYIIDDDLQRPRL